MVKRYGQLKPTRHYLWQYICLSVLCLWGISILETWPFKISNFHNGLFYDKNYIHALSNGFSGTQTEYLIEQIINLTIENLVVILILVVFCCGIIGFINDSFRILKILKKWILNIVSKIRRPDTVLPFCLMLILLGVLSCNKQTNPNIGISKENIIIPSGFENIGGKRVFVNYNASIEGKRSKQWYSRILH